MRRLTHPAAFTAAATAAQRPAVWADAALSIEGALGTVDQAYHLRGGDTPCRLSSQLASLQGHQTPN